MLVCSLFRNFPEPPTPGVFSKVTPVQMGGVLRYIWEVYCGVSLSSRLRSQRGTALQMGGVLRYKLEVYCQYFSDKLDGLGVPAQCPSICCRSNCGDGEIRITLQTQRQI